MLGYRPLADEPAAWFPSEELRKFRKLEVHIPSKIERLLFCLREDGTERRCCCCKADATQL